MFSPARTDLINDEMDVTDVFQPTNVIELPRKSIDTSLEKSGDITPQKSITVSDFCKQHGIDSDQFLALRRKASRRYPDIDFKPIREGSRTYWVQNPDVLTQLISEGVIDSKLSKSEVIEPEIVEETDLANGSKLSIVKRTASIDIPLPNRGSVTYESTDYTQIDQILLHLQADTTARNQVEEVLHLHRFADKVIERKKKENLVELLIEQGYSKEEAIKIASKLNQ